MFIFQGIEALENYLDPPKPAEPDPSQGDETGPGGGALEETNQGNSLWYSLRCGDLFFYLIHNKAN